MLWTEIICSFMRWYWTQRKIASVCWCYSSFYARRWTRVGLVGTGQRSFRVYSVQTVIRSMSEALPVVTASSLWPLPSFCELLCQTVYFGPRLFCSRYCYFVPPSHHVLSSPSFSGLCSSVQANCSLVFWDRQWPLLCRYLWFVIARPATDWYINRIHEL